MNPNAYEVYQYIARYIENQGYSPLQSEIAEALGLEQSSVQACIQSLWNVGYLCYPLHLSGMIYLTNKAPDFAAKSRQQRRQNSYGVRRQAVYHFISDYIQHQQRGPALHEIASALEIGTTTAKYHVDVLKQLGYLRQQPGKARTLQLTDQKLAS